MSTNPEAFNFCYPLNISKLRNTTIRLVPFDSHLPLFAAHYVRHTSHPSAIENFRYLAYGPFTDTQDFSNWYDSIVRSNQGVVLFAIVVSEIGAEVARRQRGEIVASGEGLKWEELKLTLPGDGEEGECYFGGSVGLLNAVAKDAVCEIGHINILPPFQRTYITTHANALLLHFLLDSPGDKGLALRRVTWLANTRNERSVKAAQRLGFQTEGVLRWHRVLPYGKEGTVAAGNEKEGKDDGRGPGRDTAVLAICWDDWRDGVREGVRRLVER